MVNNYESQAQAIKTLFPELQEDVVTIAGYLESTYARQADYSFAAKVEAPVPGEINAPMAVDWCGHVIEELNELRHYLPRRYWRNDETVPVKGSPEYQAMVEEAIDVFIVYFCMISYLGITPKEFVYALAAKTAKNVTRSDHRR